MSHFFSRTGCRGGLGKTRRAPARVRRGGLGDVSRKNMTTLLNNRDKTGHSGTWVEEGTKGQRDEGTKGRGNGKGMGTRTPGS